MGKYLHKQLLQDILKHVAKGVVEYFIIIILYFVAVLIITANIHISSYFYSIIPLAGIFLSLLCMFTAYKIENKDTKYVFLKLSFAVFGISTAHIISGYFVQFVPRVMEVIVLHHIIIIYLYFILLSLLYNIVYVYNQSVYFNQELSIKENIKYLLLYFVLGFLPFILCYLIFIREPIIYVFILLISTIIVEIIANIAGRMMRYIKNKAR